MFFVTDVPAYVRRYRKDIDEINEKILGEQVISSTSKPKQTRTPSTQRDKLAPDGIDQLLKERRKRAVTTQTTQPVIRSGDTGKPSTFRWTIFMTIGCILLVYITAVCLLQFWTNQTRKEDMAYNNSPAGMMELKIRLEKVRHTAASSTTTAAGCVRGSEATDYELEAGCFQLDNTTSSPRLVKIHSAGEFASIKSAYADKPYVIIKAEDGHGCIAGMGNDCSGIISGTNRKFIVAIPQGQQLFVNVN